MLLEEQREEVVEYGRRLLGSGLTTGTGGNLSRIDRGRGLAAISPSAVSYDRMRPEDVVVVDLAGRIMDGGFSPSSELGIHLKLYSSRKEIGAVVHTHGVYATTLACLGWEIPAVHYLVGFSGKKVPIAPYATFGTDQLAKNVVQGIGSYNAVLMANHGLIAVGTDMAGAFNVAEEIEFVARIYYQTKTIGEPRILGDDQMREVIKKFATYGRPKDL